MSAADERRRAAADYAAAAPQRDRQGVGTALTWAQASGQAAAGAATPAPRNPGSQE